MHWTTYGSSHDLWCTQITEDELQDVRRKIEAFLLSCKNRYPKLSRHLEEALLTLAEQLVPGDNNSVVFRYDDYKHLLRWSITEGKTPAGPPTRQLTCFVAQLIPRADLPGLKRLRYCR